MENFKKKGLYNKYVVTKADGSESDPRAEYFVLRLDQHQSDPKHREACRKAVVTYAKAIKDHLPQLSQDLIALYDPKGYKPDSGIQR